MAIKATIATHREGNTWVVQVAGWLSRDSALTLRDALIGKDGSIRLDLAGLRFAEQSALVTLRLLEVSGAKLEGASPYIERLLRSAPPPEAGILGEARGSLAAAGRS
jgi:hypothetical protein